MESQPQHARGESAAEPTGEPEVLVDRRGAVQLITINRPRKRNALNAAVAEQIAAAVDALDESDELSVGVLTGAGGIFSAGMDLQAFLAGERPDVGDRGLCGMTRARPRKPMIAAVEGWALAGGFELVLACDLVVAAEDARFGVPEVKRGLVAAAGAALLLPQRIPTALAMEMLLTGDPIDAEYAARSGLVNRVVQPGTALDAALALAATIADNGPLALAVTKQMALLTSGIQIDRAWVDQRPLVEQVFASVDAAEGARAFAEKRHPRWTGR